MGQATEEFIQNSIHGDRSGSEPRTAGKPRGRPVLLPWPQCPTQLLTQLEQNIWTARDWRALAAATAAVDTAYQEGAISREIAESLARWAVVVGRRLPESTNTESAQAVRVQKPGYPPDDEHSRRCGRACSWHQEDEPVCGICHPQAGLEDTGRAAA